MTYAPESSSAIRAVEAGRLDLVGTLFEVMEKKLSDFPHFDRELLLAGVRGGQKQVVQKLLDDGTDINGRVEEDEKLGIGSPLDVPLVAAASRGNIDMVRFLLESGANFEHRCVAGRPYQGGR
ncbi:hypothetical protein PG988_005986 [Apiospora saccharicola]